MSVSPLFSRLIRLDKVEVAQCSSAMGYARVSGVSARDSGNLGRSTRRSAKINENGSGVSSARAPLWVWHARNPRKCETISDEKLEKFISILCSLIKSMKYAAMKFFQFPSSSLSLRCLPIKRKRDGDNLFTISYIMQNRMKRICRFFLLRMLSLKLCLIKYSADPCIKSF